jgi:hypothetical protein
MSARTDNRRRASSLSFAAMHFDVIDDGIADDFLTHEADHWLGAPNRPFGRISYGLHVRGGLVAVAVSASTPNEKCGPYSRYEVVELVRLSAHRDHREQSRVALRCWRTLAALDWSMRYGEHWPSITALVSYQNAARHSGALYRFDGWRRVGSSRGSTGGGTWTRPRKASEPMHVWAWPLPDPVTSTIGAAA